LKGFNPSDPFSVLGERERKEILVQIMSMLRDSKIDPAVVATIAGNTPRTIYSNYSSQVSIDEQHRAENAFDRVKRQR